MTTPSSPVLLLNGAYNAWQRRGIIATLYAVNLLLAVPLMLTLRAVLSNAVGSSPYIESLLQGYDHTIYSDMTRHHEEIYEFVKRSFIPLALVSLVLNAILGPGLVASFEGDGPVRQFFHDTARFFWRSVRLLLATGLVAAAVVVACVLLAGAAWMMMTKGDVVEPTYLSAIIVSIAIVGLPLVYLVLSAEYARIFLVRNDMSSSFKAMWNGLAFVGRHPVRMAALHGSVAVVLSFSVLFYWIFEDAVGMTSVAGIFVVLIFQQASVLAKVFTRVWNTANGVGLVSTITPDIPVVTSQVPAPAELQATLPLPEPSAAIQPVAGPRRRRNVGRRVGMRPTRMQRRPRRGRHK